MSPVGFTYCPLLTELLSAGPQEAETWLAEVLRHQRWLPPEVIKA